MTGEKSIAIINAKLDIIAILNSDTNDGKSYYIALLEKEQNDITQTLRKHFGIYSWTFVLNEISSDWKLLLKDELLTYFGGFILRVKQPYINSEYDGKPNDEFDSISKKIILESHSNCEYLLETFLIDVQKIVGEKFIFNKLKVNWDSPFGYEMFYECYENDYLFDLGEKILFLHFGGSD
jgi:hypothetical protein